MRIEAPAKMGAGETRVVIAALMLCVLMGVPASSARAANGPPTALDHLAGNTLSAVTWVPRPSTVSGGGALSRFMLQAYLRQDGSALIRIWDTAHRAYTKPVERSWTLSGSTLCLDVPNPGPGRICAEVHSWGPRIAGIGTAPYVMLDGDLKPGNSLLGSR